MSTSRALSGFADLSAYFADIVDQHAQLADLVVGDSEVILTRDRSRINYPVLWLETPSFTTDWARGLHTKTYDIAFLVLCNAPTDAEERHQHIMASTERIVDEVLLRMQEDAEKGLYKLSPSQAVAEPVQGWGTDHDYGWRVEIRMTVPIASCLCSPVSTAYPGGFSWEVSADTLTLRSRHPEPATQVASWSISLDPAVAPETSVGATQVVAIEADGAVAVVVLNQAGRQHTARIPLVAGTCGRSYPYLVTPEIECR